MLVAAGNIGTDMTQSSFQLPNSPLGTLGYLAKKVLDGISIGGTGQLIQGVASYFWADSYRVFGNQIGDMSSSITLPTFERISIKLPWSSAAATTIEKSVAPKIVESAYKTALDGGTHSGFLKNYLGKSTRELQSSITSMEKNIIEHQNLINDPLGV